MLWLGRSRDVLKSILSIIGYLLYLEQLYDQSFEHIGHVRGCSARGRAQYVHTKACNIACLGCGEGHGAERIGETKYRRSVLLGNNEQLRLSLGEGGGIRSLMGRAGVGRGGVRGQGPGLMQGSGPCR